MHSNALVFVLSSCSDVCLPVKLQKRTCPVVLVVGALETLASSGYISTRCDAHIGSLAADIGSKVAYATGHTEYIVEMGGCFSCLDQKSLYCLWSVASTLLSPILFLQTDIACLTFNLSRGVLFLSR